jgi:hypothetical protein
VEELDIDGPEEESPNPTETQATPTPREPTTESAQGPAIPADLTEGGGKTRPSAADFMIEVVETPLMITENGEREARSPAGMPAGRDETEVTD